MARVHFSSNSNGAQLLVPSRQYRGKQPGGGNTVSGSLGLAQQVQYVLHGLCAVRPQLHHAVPDGSLPRLVLAVIKSRPPGVWPQLLLRT